jgi:outer membrane biogenesis lipoprotein LolB
MKTLLAIILTASLLLTACASQGKTYTSLDQINDSDRQELQTLLDNMK